MISLFIEKLLYLLIPYKNKETPREIPSKTHVFNLSTFFLALTHHLSYSSNIICIHCNVRTPRKMPGDWRHVLLSVFYFVHNAKCNHYTVMCERQEKCQEIKGMYSLGILLGVSLFLYAIKRYVCWPFFKYTKEIWIVEQWTQCHTHQYIQNRFLFQICKDCIRFTCKIYILNVVLNWFSCTAVCETNNCTQLWQHYFVNSN